MEMNKMATYEETKEALEGAIKKWELIYANAGADEGTDNCPLCELFKTRWGAGVADSRLFRGGRSVPRCYLFHPRSG